MQEKEYRDRLAEADRELNRRGSEGRLRKRTDLAPLEGSVQSEWKAEPDDRSETLGEAVALQPETSMRKRRRFTFLTIFFLFSLLFFLVAGFLAYSRFAHRENFVSPDNIEIGITGPLSVRAGSELPLEISIENKNSSSLVDVELIAAFPSGSRAPVAGLPPLSRLRESIGDVPANGFAKKAVRAVLFGEEGKEQEILFSLEYRLSGSNAIFVKEKHVSILLSDAPVRLTVDMQETVVPDAPLPIKVTVTSNASDVLRDVYLSVNYPPGFSYEKANNPPIQNSRLWSLGDIPPNGSRSIEIAGRLGGENGEAKVFRFITGVGRADKAESIAIPYNQAIHRLTLSPPELGLVLLINDAAVMPVVVSGGAIVNGEIAWVNNLPERVLGGRIILTLSGVLLEKSTIRVDRGFYDSSKDTITITEADMQELSILEPGSIGKTSFSFFVNSPADVKSIGKNATLNITASISGSAISGGAGSELSTTLSREIRVPSALSLSSRGVYSVGPFTNSGPLPPKVGVETRYTMLWSLSNAGNDLRDVVVTAKIPSAVRYVGTISPSGEEVRYNEGTREVTWRVQRLTASTGLGTDERTVAFQVAITPSLQQRDQAATLLGEAMATARDLFTQTDVQAVRKEVTTQLVTDPGFLPGQGTVSE